MRIVSILILLLVAACSSEDAEIHTTSANVDLADISTMLSAMDDVTENSLDLDALNELSTSVPMDKEQQLRFSASYKGSEHSVLYHVWREQEDWVHVYASSESNELVDELGDVMKSYERAAEE